MTDDSTITRREALQGATGLAAATALGGCSEALGGAGGSGGDDASAGGSIRYASVLPPRTLDPVVAAEPWSMQVARRLFDGLYEFDRNLSLRPALAAGPPDSSAGGRRHRVRLRPEVRFHDGSPVTAGDVKYSFEAPLDERGVEAANAWQVNVVDEIRTPDERTVEFRLRHPYPAFRQSLTRPVVPKAAREAAPESFGEEPVGSGPYRLESFSPHGHAELSARADYRGAGSAGVSRARFVGNHSGLARTTSLKTGQNDVIERVQPKLKAATEQMPSARVTSVPGFQYLYVGFNTNDGPMANPAVRSAVDATVDLDDAVEHFVKPFGTRTYAPMPRRVADAWDLPVERWREVPRPKDTGAAKRTFRREVKRNEDVQAGWQPTVAVPKHDMLREKVGELLVHGLKDAGFARARVRKYPWRSFREKVMTGSADDYDLFVGSWAGGPDPDAYLYPLFHEAMEGRTNGTFFHDRGVMRALERARRTTDRATRRRLYARAVGTLLAERAHLPVCTLAESFGVKERVAGFEPHPLAAADPRLAGRDPVQVD